MQLRRAFAHDPGDTDEVRLEKTAIFIVAGACCVAGLVWSAVYAAVFGWGLIAALPLVFVVIVGPGLVVSHVTTNHYYAMYAQIACIMLIPALLQWTIGGLLDSGFVMIWALSGPLAALFFLRARQAAVWFLLWLGLVVVTVLFDDTFARQGYAVSSATRALFFVMNVSICSLVIFLFAGYFVGRAKAERLRAEALLLNILPEEIAPRLKADEGTIADQFDSASVLFADMVGSTPLFARLSADEAVDWLNQVFSAFDRLVAESGLEKIRTIGDNYMVAAGVPTRRPDHAPALIDLALEMRKTVEELPPRNGRRIGFRFGIHTGPVVAGVIGTRKFQYDVWGDTVNTASRMESHGETGKIHITGATRALCGDAFEYEPRGEVEIKGKGRMETWFVVGRAGVSAPPSGATR